MTEEFCGTGGAVTLPGDPELGIGSVSARGTIDGIAVTWTLPADSHAIAVTKIYRARNSTVFAHAVAIRTIGGDYYLDQLDLDEDIPYSYWIQFVSINGTVGPILGPATAQKIALIDYIITQMNDRVTLNHLNSSLRNSVASITETAGLLGIEQDLRETGEAALSGLYANVQSALDEQGFVLSQESIIRAQEDAVVLGTVNAQIVQLQTETTSTLAGQREEFIALVDEDSALAQRTSTLEATVGSAMPGEPALTVKVQEQSVVLNGISAEHTVKIDNNGRITGFGVYDGPEEEDSIFLVLAENFAVATDVDNEVGDAVQHPFIVSKVNGVNRIALNAQTFIPDATITSAKIAQSLQSTNWKNGVSGWDINKDGNAHFNNIYARGNIEATSMKAGTVDVISTLMLQGNAVTVPLTTTGAVVTGNGQWIEMVAGSVFMRAPGLILVFVSFEQGYPGGQADWGMQVKHDQSGAYMINRGGMTAVNDLPAWTGARHVSTPTTHTFRVFWKGENSNINAKATLTLMGAQR